MKKGAVIAALAALSGCISIPTHEQQMKIARDRIQELEQYKARAEGLEAKNADLEKSLTEKSQEHEILKSEMSNVRNTYDELVQELKDNIANGDVGVQQTDKGLTITMGNQILFQSGSADLQVRGKKVLLQISGIIRKAQDRLIQVEGHTDNIRIAGALKARFPSNWELSAARSASVVRFLQEEGKLDPALLVLTAYAENHPIGDNHTPAGRQQNRRVEITLIPKPR